MTGLCRSSARDVERWLRTQEIECSLRPLRLTLRDPKTISPKGWFGADFCKKRPLGCRLAVSLRTDEHPISEHDATKWLIGVAPRDRERRLMLGNIAKKIFGSSNDRRLKRYGPQVAAINALEPEIQKLSDAELQDQTQKFRDELAAGQERRRSAGPGLRDGCARRRGACSASAISTCSSSAGMVLHEGAIAEMRTGRGQDARRDARLLSQRARPAKASTSSRSTITSPAATPTGWAASTISSGLSYGVIVHGLDDEQRHAAYAADITYGTNNEFGFDYLRDNMKYDLAQMVQRGHAYAIVDEVDSILVDEARTPLIISGPSDDRSELYNAIDLVLPRLVREDYDLDEKQRTVQSHRSGQRAYRGIAARYRHPQGRARSMRRATSRWCITSIRRCGRTNCFSATRITSSATMRSSSSTSSPAV